MSIISDLRDYIATLDNYATPIIDILLGDSRAISVRAEPGASNEMRDLTGKRYGDFQFSIYCKTPDPEEAVTQLVYYISVLDLEDFPIGGKTNIKCEPITEAHYIGKAENGEVLYTASFHINYFQGA